MSRYYKLPCGCAIESATDKLHDMCPACWRETIERHKASADERALVRETLTSEQHGYAEPI